MRILYSISLEAKDSAELFADTESSAAPCLGEAAETLHVGLPYKSVFNIGQDPEYFPLGHTMAHLPRRLNYIHEN